MEPEVLKQNDLPCLHRVYCFLRFFAYAVLRKNDLGIQKLAQTLCDGSEGKLRLDLALRTSEVRHQYYLSAVVEQVLDRRESRLNARLVCDLPVFIQRHVEINAHKHLFSLYVNIFNRFFHDLYSFFNRYSHTLLF